MNEYVLAKQDQEVMEIAYRMLHRFIWESEIQSKNEFYYELTERVQNLRQGNLEEAYQQ